MPLRFPGQYYDSESGLHYNYFRTYDPGTGRYLTSDPIGLAGGLNTYSYADNNPANYADSSGLFPDAFVDFGFILYDIGSLAYNAFKGCDTSTDKAALGADVLGLLTPGGTGFGLAVRAGKKVTKGGGQTFERVVSNAELKATQKSGLLRGGREGGNFFTNNASLNAKRAQQRLGLDGPLRDARIQFRIKNNVEVTGPRPAAPGRTGTAGGGREFSTNGRTEIEILRVDRLRK